MLNKVRELHHGAGSSQAQWIMITSMINLKEKQKVAKDLCGIEKGDQLS